MAHLAVDHGLAGAVEAARPAHELERRERDFDGRSLFHRAVAEKGLPLMCPKNVAAASLEALTGSIPSM
jgi:hypothetical protein